ncbi:MAG: hypothetical protein KKA05_01645 [Alphaproteobacteria bacterium]|nr:hypothetical protein [Alphaproteobacteria bacterium]
MTDTNAGKPCLAVYGDGGEQKVTKTIWSLLAGRDLRILSLDSFTALEEQATSMVMILIVVKSADDPNVEMVRH